MISKSKREKSQEREARRVREKEQSRQFDLEYDALDIRACSIILEQPMHLISVGERFSETPTQLLYWAERDRRDAISSLLFFGASDDVCRELVRGADRYAPDRMLAAWWRGIRVSGLKVSGPSGIDEQVRKVLFRPIRELLDNGILSPHNREMLLGREDPDRDRYLDHWRNLRSSMSAKAKELTQKLTGQ